jgi:hypothetical protein
LTGEGTCKFSNKNPSQAKSNEKKMFNPFSLLRIGFFLEISRHDKGKKEEGDFHILMLAYFLELREEDWMKYGNMETSLIHGQIIY